ncbi:proteasome assembly chaperone family protein [Ruania alba]|uniref:Predicted ATP-dependent carboligase, ATP-grasp superfamily n=1 Tax=Ruania alba TaxID=648782 RepID=A0A1H5E8G5_9MICO|nr:PAC2 family protein [Ruania alba]SED87316.1 Predicted ATP-dependent carboligase, ATP-grasp superfamily [Ruania alba]
MNDPRDLYRIADEAPELRDGEAPVLVHALSGSIDAGHAGSLLARHLSEKLPTRRLLEFDIDLLLDYRSRRPVMTFAEGTWVEYEQPELVIDLVRDDDGVAMLLMHGLEPDLQWERFVSAVRSVIEEYGVELTIGVHGIPMGVPHTRPLTVTAHATRDELIEAYPNYFSRVQVPGSAAALLELRLGQEGRDALGFAVNVPHYLAQTEYPQAAAELVRQITNVSGMSLPIGDLEASGTQVRAEVDRQVAESEEVSAVVQALERQYDSFVEANGAAGAGAIEQVQSGLDELPSADELAAQFEAFLAGREDEPPAP